MQGGHLIRLKISDFPEMLCEKSRVGLHIISSMIERLKTIIF